MGQLAALGVAAIALVAACGSDDASERVATTPCDAAAIGVPLSFDAVTPDGRHVVVFGVDPKRVFYGPADRLAEVTAQSPVESATSCPACASCAGFTTGEVLYSAVLGTKACGGMAPHLTHGGVTEALTVLVDSGAATGAVTSRSLVCF